MKVRIDHAIIALLILAALIAYQQYITFGQWFEVKDIHHEMFIVAFAFGALVLWLVKSKKITL